MLQSETVLKTVNIQEIVYTEKMFYKPSVEDDKLYL